jgi:Leucine-rich repeat (LRR) protein
MDDLDHPCVAQWLKQHGQLISHLTVRLDGSQDELNLSKLSQATAACRSIDLEVCHNEYQELDLADLGPVAGSLRCLGFGPIHEVGGSIRGASTFESMSQITSLKLLGEDLVDEEPWGSLASLTSLQQLHLEVTASGDPSPLSALTKLSSLQLQSIPFEAEDQNPFSFSSLQPLSTLRQLEVLQLWGHACAAMSLHGLAGLSNLKVFGLLFGADVRALRSLEGISPAVVDVVVRDAPDLVSLAGLEVCTNMKKLSLRECSVSSLQPLRGLSNLKQLGVFGADNLSTLELEDVPGLLGLHRVQLYHYPVWP